MAHLGHRRPTRLTAAAKLREKRRIVHGIAAEPTFAKLVSAAESLDVADQVFHSDGYMRRTNPSRQVTCDGFVRKLWRTCPSWDTLDMAASVFDLPRIISVLREATSGPDATFSQRSLSKEAGEGRDCVGDIINGRNKNPTSKVLANLAGALGGDLSMFGLADVRDEPPTEAELEQALRDMLPGMPRGSPDRRARYLAETVGRALKLPPGRQPTDEAPRSTGDAEVSPPPGSTN